MTTIKSGPKGGPPRPSPVDNTSGAASGAEGAGQGERARFPAVDGAREAADPTSPAAIVGRLRAGEINFEQAVDILVSRTLDEPHLENVESDRREEMRKALTDLVADDPALSALANIMKR